MKQSWTQPQSKALGQVLKFIIFFISYLVIAAFISVSTSAIAQTSMQTIEQSTDKDLKVIIVNDGDSLSGLATRYGITVSELMDINSLTSTSIMAGEYLFVPIGDSALSDDSVSNTQAASVESTITSRNFGDLNSPTLAYETITIAQGDTLSKLAIRYGSSIESIQSHNELSGHTIFAGQQLEIPFVGVSNSNTDRQPDAFGYITVLPNDTIGALATTFCTSPESLMGQNALLEPTIYVGQRLFVGQLETLTAMSADVQ